MTNRAVRANRSILPSPRLPQPAAMAAAGPATMLRDELARRIKAKLLGYGWLACPSNSAVELACFAYLLPPPDATFTVLDPDTGEPCLVALHFAESDNAVWYACTMRHPGGFTAQEHGLLDVVSGAVRITATRGDMLRHTSS